MIKASKTKRKRAVAKARNTRTKKNGKLTGGGAGPDSALCKKDINEVLMPENKTVGVSLTGDPKQFANDIKKQTTDIGNLGKSNWLAGPGPPPSFPKCVIM